MWCAMAQCYTVARVCFLDGIEHRAALDTLTLRVLAES